MKVAAEFKNMMQATEDVYKERLDIIKEANLAMDNKYGDVLREKFGTKSRYMSPDHMVSKYNMVESVSLRLPTFLFGANDQFAVDAQKSMSDFIKTVITTFGVDAKIIDVVNRSFDSGVGVAELYVKKIVDKGWRLPDDWDENTNNKMQAYEETRGWGLDLRVYDVIEDEIRISPDAHPHDVAGTASYVILKHGEFTLDGLENLASELGVSFDKTQVGNRLLQDYRAVEINSKHGVNKGRTPLYAVHKVYYNDGTVDWVVGETYLLAEKRPNSKLIAGIPLVFLTPFPGSKQPYGLCFWELIKHASNLVSGVVNLAADAAVKNINASIITDSSQLADRMNTSDLFDRKIINIGGDGRDVRQRVSQIQIADMTPALNMLLQIGSRDTQRIGRVSNLQMGIQDKQVRSPGVAAAMAESSVSARSMYVRMVENTLYRPLGQHIVKTIYNHYPKFKDIVKIEREKFNIANVRVKNGSVLEEDRRTHLQVLEYLYQLTREYPYDWETKQVITDMFKEMGLPEIEAYMSDPKKGIVKMLLALQVPQEVIQGIIGTIQQTEGTAQPQGGQNAERQQG